MSLEALIRWTRVRGPAAAILLVLGLAIDWLCLRLGAYCKGRLAANSSGDPLTARWASLVDSSIRNLGHLLLIMIGAGVVADVLGLELDLSALLRWLRTTGIQLAIIAILALFAARVVNLAGQYAEGAVLRRRQRANGELAQRARTVGAVARNFGLAVIAVVTALMILATLGVNTAPLLASAGVAGVAIGFGAQTLVKDVISGLFILLEDQFAVGDTIQVAGTAGQVERMTVRATVIRDFSGTLHIVPNGEIRTVANLTRDWSRAIVDVGIGYDVPLQQALTVLNDAIQALAQDPAFAPLLLGEPQVMGVQELGPALVLLRATLKTQPGEHWRVAREANRRVKEAFERAGLRMRPAPLLKLTGDTGMDSSTA